MFERLKNYFSRYALRNVSFLSISQVVELGAGLVYSILVVRFLGGVLYGQLLVVISAAKILDQSLHLKLEKPLTSVLRQALDGDNRKRFDRENTAAVVLTLASTGIGGTILLIGSIVEYYFDFFTLNWILLTSIFFTSLFLRHLRNIIFTNFQAAQLFGNLSYLKVISSLSLNFVPLLFLRYELFGICVGYLTGEVFILMSYVLLLIAPFSRSKSLIPRFDFDAESIASLFGESWQYYQAKLIDRLGDNLGNVFIAYFGGPKTLSFFNVGQKFFKFNIVVFPALRSYLFPRLVQKWNERRDEFFYTLKKYLMVSTAFTMAVLAGLLLVVPFLLPFLYGNAFVPAVSVFFLMVPGYLIGLAPGNIFREVCFATDNVNTYRLLNFVTNPGFLLILIPLTYYYSFYGAALAVTVRRSATGLFDLYWFYGLYRSHRTGSSQSQ